MNVFNFTGNLGQDAETRFTNDGKPITSFSVAVKAGYGKSETTTWVNCSLWGDRAEKLAEYLKKGTLVGVSGEFQLRAYKTKDGTEKLSPDVRVNDLTLLSRGNVQPKENNAPKSDSGGYKGDIEDDIPFDNPYKGKKSYVV